jgi:hypothetical protein
MESFLSGGIPNLVTENPIFKPALLRQESCADGRFFVSLEVVGDLDKAGE